MSEPESITKIVERELESAEVDLCFLEVEQSILREAFAELDQTRKCKKPHFQTLAESQAGSSGIPFAKVSAN